LSPVPLAVEAPQSAGGPVGHLLFSSVGDRLGTTTAARPSVACKGEALRQPCPYGGSAAPLACRFPLESNGPGVSGRPSQFVRNCVVSGLQVHTLTDATVVRWDQFVEASSAATFFHRAAWKTILERSFGHSTYFFYAE